MYVALPAVTATPADRLQALKDSKTLLAGTPKTTSGFFAGSVEPTDAVAPESMIRLAEYITTGHDYKDTHPTGKRRPVIKQVTNVTVMAPQGTSDEDLAHLISHIEDGSFADFMRDMIREQEAAHGAEETEADVADKVEDEPEHEPQVDGDRPRFGSKASDFS